ncbi:MAG: hypothetical protein ACD_58C00003G0003 [uncultured bacterium]|nr:MAG: hypothetical protein ACD_58C00003G0003 [uncultured bacterium]
MDDFGEQDFSIIVDEKRAGKGYFHICPRYIGLFITLGHMKFIRFLATC